MKDRDPFSICPLTHHIKAKRVAGQNARTPSASHHGLSTSKQVSYQEVSCDTLGSMKFLTLKSLIGKIGYLSNDGELRTVA